MIDANSPTLTQKNHMNPLNIAIQKVHPDAKTPTYGTEHAFCFDLYATHGGIVVYGKPIILGTGLAFEIPPGYGMLIFPRSGHGFKYDVSLANGTGIIDADYRGEVMVKLSKAPSDSGMMSIRPGERIAQASIFPKISAEFSLCATLSATDRGTGGFGSTGK